MWGGSWHSSASSAGALGQPASTTPALLGEVDRGQELRIVVVVDTGRAGDLRRGGTHRLVGRPPLKEKASRWRQSLTGREVEIFEAEAGDLLKMLGYPPEFGVTARPARPLEMLRMRLGDLAQRGRNNLRRRWRAYQSFRQTQI